MRLNRPSDFMTGHMLAFARADTANAAAWRSIHGRIANIIGQFADGSEATGLVPDFMVKSGTRFVPAPGKVLETRHNSDYYYNACRTPWRLPMSHLNFGNGAMMAALGQQNAWIRQATGGDPSRIKAGYYVLNGPNGTAFKNYSDLPFRAPFAVVAMLGGAPGQEWLNALWDSITGEDFALTTDYFGDSIRLQVLITVSGNWWAPSVILRPARP